MQIRCIFNAHVGWAYDIKKTLLVVLKDYLSMKLKIIAYKMGNKTFIQIKYNLAMI